MEGPVLQNALLDMLSVTDTAVNSIGIPRSQSKKETDGISVSQSSSVSLDSCKESIGSTTASEVLISSTYVGKSDINFDSRLPKQITVVRHDGAQKSQTECTKAQPNQLLRLISESTSFDEETASDKDNDHVIIENANHSIVSVEGRITNTNTRMPVSNPKTQKIIQDSTQHETNPNFKKLQQNSFETGTSDGSASGHDDVKIETFHLTEKQKSLRQALGKKSDPSQPVKRVIHPKIINQKLQDSTRVQAKDPVVTKETVSNEMLAASVAASAAAAVAQPFFQFQKDFEEKISKTFGKCLTEKPSSVDNSRLEELEKKVSALNEQRIDHLERLQHYQMQIQAQLLTLPCKQTGVQTYQNNISQSVPSVQVIDNSPQLQLSPPKKPEPKYFPQRVPSLKMSPTKVPLPTRAQPPRRSPPKRSPPRQEVKYFPVKRRDYPAKAKIIKYSEKRDSPLDTPAHRTRVPTPMDYDDDNHSLQSDSRFHNGALLEEILARNPTTQKDSTFSVPENTMYNRYDYEDGEKPVDQASRLLDQMVDLKHQVGRVVHKTHDVKYNYGPYPLDPYLKNVIGDIKSQPIQVNAPVFNNYGDVKKVLNTVNKKIQQLESNLKHVTRGQQDDEISFLEILSQDSNDGERTKVKSMMDKLIKSQRKYIEGGVQRELLNAELKQREIEESKKIKDVNKKTSVGRIASTYCRKKEQPVLPTTRDKKPTVYKHYGKNLLPSNKEKYKTDDIQKSEVKTVYKKLITQVQPQAPTVSNVIPMAVPLCQPRFLSGRMRAEVLSCDPLASSSPSSYTHQLSMANVSNIDETTFTELHQQMLSPSPRDDSEIPPHQDDSILNTPDEDQFGTGIVLPGYQHPVHKPVLQPSKISSKPPTLESYKQNPSSDVIATDIHRQNVLEDRAFQWLESELLAHVLSKVNKAADGNVRHESSWNDDHQYHYSNIDQGQVSETDETTDNSVASSQANPEVVSDDIRQVFIDAGKPVNTHIISTLVQEAIADKISAFLGLSRAGISERNKGNEANMDRDEYDDDFESGDSPELSMKHIQTPDLTPVSSPLGSPVRKTSPPPVRKTSPPPSPKKLPKSSQDHKPDDSLLYNSFLPVNPEETAYLVSDSESYTSYDISQELRRLASKPDDKLQTVSASLHDIETPVSTPPPRSPSPVVQTLPQFISSPPLTPTLVSPTITRREDMNGYQDLQATGTSVQFNLTRSSLQDYSINEMKKTTTLPRVSTNSIRGSMEEPQISPQQNPKPIISLQSPPRTPSPKLDAYSPVASPEHQTTPSTSITETINECISEGQWLLNRSEGQIAEIPIDQDVMNNVQFTRIDLSTASTLKDTEDLDLDDMDVLKSEGEFIHYSSVPVERDIDSIIRKQQESLQRGIQDLPYYHARDTSPEPRITESMGELSIGQIQSSGIIQVSEHQSNMPPRSFGGSDQLGTFTLQSKEEERISPDSTMNLEELDMSKRRTISPSKMRWDGPTKASMSDGSVRNSGILDVTGSEVESGHYNMRLSADSEGSAYSYDEDSEPVGTGNGLPYRMSVTVPSVHPIAEDEDSEEISEITN